jgi:hypothetical protein
MIDTGNKRELNMKDISIEIPIKGQSITVEDAINKFLAEAESEQSLLRHELNRLARITY